LRLSSLKVCQPPGALPAAQSKQLCTWTERASRQKGK